MEESKQWFVYILICKDKSLYTGITNRLEKRIKAHQSGKGAKYTRSRLPIELIYKERSLNMSEALKREYEIKSWSRQKKIKFLEKNGVFL